MKLAFVFPCLPLIAAQCSSLKSNIMPQLIDNQFINLSGQPINTKMGAAIKTEQGIFYLSNMADWGENQYQEVKVSGVLQIETVENNPNEPIKTQATGKIYWLENYKIL
jgi:hypothetical protein